MSDQDRRQAPALPRPSTEDAQAWKAYWQAQGQPWRTQPEIDIKRQEELARRRAIVPDIEKGIYPLKDMKLSRADVEWLLAKEESESHSTASNDDTQRKREGLDLREANLSGENLSGLPLSSTNDGLPAVHMERCKLQSTNLAKATLCYAQLQEADLSGTILREADLSDANLEKAHLEGADLKDVRLQGACFKSAYFNSMTSLENVSIADAKDIGPQLVDTHWGDVNLSLLDWSSIKMLGDEYKTRWLVDEWGEEENMDTFLDEYRMAIRANSQLAVALRDQGINEHADWFAYRAQVLKRRLLWKQLHLPMILSRQKRLGWKEQVQKALLDEKEITGQVSLSRVPRREPVLSVLILSFPLFSILPLFLAIGMPLFGILRFLGRKEPKIKKLIPHWLWLKNLLVFLKQESFALLTILLFLLTASTDLWFAYSSWEAFNPSVELWVKVTLSWLFTTILGLLSLFLVTRIQIWWLKRKIGQRPSVLEMFLPSPEKADYISGLEAYWFVAWVSIICDDLVSFGQYLFSLLLGILSGYGYKPGRTLFWYLVVIFGFAIFYSTSGALPLFPDAVVFSLTSFHGRGFFPNLSGETSLHSPLVVLAAAEAVIGLFIEASIIATFTQRFFGR